MQRILLSDLSFLEWNNRTSEARSWYSNNNTYNSNSEILIKQAKFPWEGNFQIDNHFTLAIVYSGKFSLEIDNKADELEKKDFILLQPNSKCHFTSLDIGSEIYFVHINSRYVHRVLMPLISRNEQMYHFFADYLFGMDNNRVMILKSGSDLTCSILDNIISEYAHKELYYQGVLDCSISLVFYYLIRDFNDTLKNNNKKNRILHTTMKYLENNYNTASLQELADILHYNVSYLSNSIKKITGHSFSEILRQIRMKYACNLLVTTSHTVAEVAALVGYSDRAIFQRAFKKEFNISPSEYRNKSKLSKDTKISHT